MKMNQAEEMSLKSFVNAFFRENSSALEFTTYKSNPVARYRLKPLDLELCIPINYYSLTGRHQYDWPAFVVANGQEVALHPWCVVGMLLQDLSHYHPEAPAGHGELLRRFFNSCDNLNTILKHWSQPKIDALFGDSADFKLTENGLLTGHQMHPMPKSREGFTQDEFLQYSPELEKTFQLHYFLADKAIVWTDSALDIEIDLLFRHYLLERQYDTEKLILPLHPWQARYLVNQPTIQNWLKHGLLIDMGTQGEKFSATSSVRTVYSKNIPFMLKLSLNVAITNSKRNHYANELIRGVAAHRFWQSEVGVMMKKTYPQFEAITDPGFVSLRNGDTILNESAVLLRLNPFKEANNITSLATLCQDHPYTKTNRFNALIACVAHHYTLSTEEAAALWFEQFLKVAIEPLLWLYMHYGVAVEAHQQNVLIALDKGLPCKSYYRDNQGYYITTDALPTLSKQVDPSILAAFCVSTTGSISHHFTYYLLGNSILGVINALGMAGWIDENKLLVKLHAFVLQCLQTWDPANDFLRSWAEDAHLPFKGNLLTRFYGLDELLAPIETQSIYIDIPNPLKMRH